MILVTGAAGKTGLAVLRALRPPGEHARALVRRDEQKDAAREAGAEDVIRGDLLDRNSLARALAGVRAIYHICPNVSPDEVAIADAVLMEAKAAGVEHIVYHSVLHPQTESMPHHWRKLRVEEALFESGLEVTILQPAAYMQNLLGAWRRVVDEGIHEVPYSLATRLSLVDLENVAEVAARILTEPGHRGAVYELCGVEAPDQRQVAALLAEALGRPVEAVAISISTWRERALRGGLGAERCDTLCAMFRYYDRHGFLGNPNVLRWLLGRDPTTLRDFILGVAQAPRDP